MTVPYPREDFGRATSRRTIAVRAPTSTVQTSPSPGSSPRIVATVCGTVVLTDPEPGTARKIFEVNWSTIGSDKEREDLTIGPNGDLQTALNSRTYI